MDHGFSQWSMHMYIALQVQIVSCIYFVAKPDLYFGGMLM